MSYEGYEPGCLGLALSFKLRLSGTHLEEEADVMRGPGKLMET